MKPTKSLTGFENYVEETIDEGVAYLSQHGWLDAKTGGPDLDKIPDLHSPQEVPLPVEAKVAVSRTRWNGPAHEYQGNLITASVWYELGQYDWRGGRTVPGENQPVPDLMTRETVAIHQLPAAVCADRVGQVQRAHDLYRWAAGNYLLTDEEIPVYAAARDFQTIWEFLPMRAYALACLGDWPGALQAAEFAEQWASKDRRAQTTESYRLQLQLLPTLLALARYELNPSLENRALAQKGLALRTITSRNWSERLLCYFYLYNLRARFGGELLEDKRGPD
jgi:hypothetical protein